jgi:hypothetical protein
MRVLLASLHRRAQEIGADVQVVTHESGAHGFGLRNHDARSREILREAVAFVRARI